MVLESPTSLCLFFAHSGESSFYIKITESEELILVFGDYLASVKISMVMRWNSIEINSFQSQRKVVFRENQNVFRGEAIKVSWN